MAVSAQPASDQAVVQVGFLLRRLHTSIDPQSGYSGSHFYDPVIVSTTLG